MTIKKIEQLEIDVEELEIQETETLQEVLIFPFFFCLIILFLQLLSHHRVFVLVVIDQRDFSGKRL